MDQTEIREYKREWKVNIPDELVNNLINVLNSGCTKEKEMTKKSEYFLMMMPQIMKLRSIDQKIELYENQPNYSQKFGLSLICDTQGNNIF